MAPVLQPNCDHPSEPERPEVATTAAELEHCSQHFITVFSSRDFELQSYEGRQLLEHLDPKWQARFDNALHTLSFDKQIEEWRQMAKEHPRMSLKVRDVHSEVQMKFRIASVHVLVWATNVQTLQMQAFCEFKWKFAGGKWMCYHYIAMRGVDTV